MEVRQIECDDQSGCLLLHGALDFANVSRVWQEGKELVRSGEVRLIDLAAIERTDSAGVALLVEWTRLAHQAGVGLLLRNAPTQMRAIVHASGAEDLLAMPEPGDDSRVEG